MSKKIKDVADSISNSISANPEENSYRFLTGSTLLDMVIGGDKGIFGCSSGRIINIVGDKSSGKTFLSLEIIAQAYHKYGSRFKWNYDDSETGFTFNTSKIYGFNIGEEEQLTSHSVEELYGNVRLFSEELEKNELGIYVVDSLDSLGSEAQKKRSDERFAKHKKGEKYDKGTYGMEKQKFLSQEFFGEIADLISNKNILLIIVSQVRDNIDPFSFKKQTRAGGKALDFYCHSVIWLANIAKLKKSIGGEDRTYGVYTKARLEKSKTPRPFRECNYYTYFDYGIDDIATNIAFLYECVGKDGKWVKSAQKLQWGEEGAKEPNKSNILEFLTENDRLEDFKEAIGTYKKDLHDDYIKAITEDEELMSKFNKEFGQTFKVKDLIAYIEENNLEDTLKRRVVDKWENIEDQVKTKRKKKFC